MKNKPFTKGTKALERQNSRQRGAAVKKLNGMRVQGQHEVLRREEQAGSELGVSGGGRVWTRVSRPSHGA